MRVRHSTATMVAVLVLAVGCGTTEDTSAPDSTGGSPLEPPSATLVDGAEFIPPDDQTTAGPVTELVAEVDLTDVAPDDVPYAIYAVGTEDGAYVAVASGIGTRTWLATVGPSDGGLAVTDTAEIQPFYSLRGIDGMYVLDDGSVLVAGEFAFADPPEYSGTPDYGFVVVDPESGESRTTSVVPAGRGGQSHGDGHPLRRRPDALRLREQEQWWRTPAPGGRRGIRARSSPSTTSRRTR